MALTIGSVGGRAEQRRNLLIHAAGVMAGAMVMALTLILVGSGIRALFPHPGFPIGQLAAAVLIAWALRVATGIGLPFPNSRWQVPKDWRYSLPFGVTAGAYGFLLGLGLLTNVVLPLLWVLVGASVLISNAWVVLVIWAIYGLTRAATTAREAMIVGESADPGSQPARPPSLALAKWASCALLALLALHLVI